MKILLIGKQFTLSTLDFQLTSGEGEKVKIKIHSFIHKKAADSKLVSSGQLMFPLQFLWKRFKVSHLTLFQFASSVSTDGELRK